MKREPLAAVVRLRWAAQEDAARELADCLRVEAEAQQAVSAIRAAIERETEAASNLDADDAVVEAFGIWLKRARKDLRDAEAARERAETDTTRSRAVLAAARAAVKAAEEMLETKAAIQRTEAGRREQQVLDEVGQRQRR